MTICLDILESKRFSISKKYQKTSQKWDWQKIEKLKKGTVNKKLCD